jgi:hypothetical protein
MKAYIKALLALLAGNVCAEEGPVCQKCERIREYNAAHPENNYYYYEDYLKDLQKKEVAEASDQAKQHALEGKK